MHFIPVVHPFFPLSGVLIVHTVVVFALAKDAKRCSRPYINGLCMMELTLLSVAMASVAPTRGMIMFWDMLLMASRFVLCPCWLWMALDTSGLRPFGLDSKKVYFIAMIPVAVFTLLLFLNPVLGWYWPVVRFEGDILVVERSLLPRLNTIYCQLLLVAGSFAYFVGVLRHGGNERIRLIVLAGAYAFLFAGDWVWRLEIPLLDGYNPLSFFQTIGFYLVGVSLLLFGFPRIKGPITDADLEALPRLQLIPQPQGQVRSSDRDQGRNEARPLPFNARQELSERQESILRMVMEGIPYKAIASELGITERTVKYHMGQILDKCGLETREQLIAWAALRGLASPAGATRP